MDAFDVLALAPGFDLDPSELERRYRELQRQLHPDKFVQASPAEKRESLSRAVNVNEAYRALRDELKRAEILLARVGPAPDTASSGDPELLMEMMEMREALAEAKVARDVAAVQALVTQVTAREAEYKQILRDALSALGEARDQGRLELAHQTLSRLRYYRRFHDEVARFEEEMLE